MQRSRFFRTCPVVAVFLIFISAPPDGNPENRLEWTSASVLAYPALDPMALENGHRVTDAKQWNEQRRPEILKSFVENVYGRTPRQRLSAHYAIRSVDEAALGGRAVRKQLTISFNGESGPEINVLVYVPKSKGPVPVFVGLNFSGNHTIHPDPRIALGQVWVTDPSDSAKIPQQRRHLKQLAPESSRGQYAVRWQVEQILAHGYGLATAYYGDIEPDFNGGLPFGVRSLYMKQGATQVGPDEWGALGAWAWGLSRIVDYLQTDPAIDRNHIAAFGHSRLGKAALWASAQDSRFTLVISNESGMGGASLYRAKSGETIEHLNHSFPHWFCARFHEFTGHPDRVPVDGNLLLALIAPRPLYVSSAEEDSYSNPRAEFLSLWLACPVYKLFGRQGLPSDTLPPIDTPVMNDVGYHERSGVHEVTAFDWQQYLKFADMHFHPSRAQ